MKKSLLYLAAAAFAGLLFVSCNPTPAETGFDESYLYSGSGEWVSTQTIAGEQHEIHDRFNADGTGSTRSVTDDAPWQDFEWTLEGDRLTFRHNIDMGGTLPKDYTVTMLSATRLVYNDRFGTVSCTKL